MYIFVITHVLLIHSYFFLIKNILILIFMRYYGSFVKNKKRIMLYVQPACDALVDLNSFILWEICAKWPSKNE